MDDLNAKQANPTGEAAEGGAGPVSTGFVPLETIRATNRKPLDLAAIRKKLQARTGKEYWRSLDEVAETEEFKELLEREFPMAPKDMLPLPRREFLKLMGASLALAGIGGCAYQPAEDIVPYVEQPEALIPGKSMYFATAYSLGGYALGVLAESQMGRPVKLEGNPDHPASLGATDAYTQASILNLYDPDRSRTVRNLGDQSTWDVFLGTITGELDAQRAKRGAGLRILTETVTSPAMFDQIRAVLTAFPAAKWHQYEPVNRGNVHAGARIAFGTEVHPVYHFDRARRILSIDGNFLLEDPGRIRYSKDFSSRRRVRNGTTEINRLYAVESTPTITGSMADHRLPVMARHIEAFTRALASSLGVPGATAAPASVPGVPADWLAALVKDLQDPANRGASVVVTGEHQPPIVHALVHAINAHLGNVGSTVTYIAPVEASPADQVASLRDFVTDMNSGAVDLVVVIGANPVFNSPADIDFAAAFQRVPLRVHLGSHDDETGVLCQWHLPESHYLEAWGDARAFDGTVTITQPLIQPLYDSKSPIELLAALAGQGDRSGYDIVKGYWQTQRPGPGFEKWWQTAVHDGLIRGSAAPAVTPALRTDFITTPPSPAGSGMEVIFRRDPAIWDGRFANNGWLQEMPKPLTTMAWDNAVLMSPKNAESFKLSTGDRVEVNVRGRKAVGPVWIMPGHPEGSVTIYLGYGRTRSGKVGNGTGFNAYALRTSDAMDIASGVEIRRVSGHTRLASIQGHFNMEGRDLVRVGTIDEYLKDPERPEFARGEEEESVNPSILPQVWPSDRRKKEDQAHTGIPNEDREEYHFKSKGYNGQPIPAWGMVVDNSLCISCNACIMACNAENNIPVVGKDQVLNSREMHWLRIDTYYQGDLDNPEFLFEPMFCQHCEKAPCEPVCPVEATTHSAEGINEMTYNRCVGTRYCSNNCPYKVRRFNYFQYSDQKTPTIQMMHNPDVTVRSRGVMEKCTYCVQRVNEARIEAEKEDRPIRDGDVMTACQQVCPTNVFTFGNINDDFSNGGKGSAVSQLKASGLNYGVLTELNTAPRTTYFAKVKNPNPELAKYGVRESESGAEG